MQTTVQDLPVEVLERITQLLPASTRRSDCLALLRVSRIWYGPAIRELFSFVELDDEDHALRVLDTLRQSSDERIVHSVTVKKLCLVVSVPSPVSRRSPDLHASRPLLTHAPEASASTSVHRTEHTPTPGAGASTPTTSRNRRHRRRPRNQTTSAASTTAPSSPSSSSTQQRSPATAATLSRTREDKHAANTETRAVDSSSVTSQLGSKSATSSRRPLLVTQAAIYPPPPSAAAPALTNQAERHPALLDTLSEPSSPSGASESSNGNNDNNNGGRRRRWRRRGHGQGRSSPSFHPSADAFAIGRKGRPLSWTTASKVLECTSALQSLTLRLLPSATASLDERSLEAISRMHSLRKLDLRVTAMLFDEAMRLLHSLPSLASCNLAGLVLDDPASTAAPATVTTATGTDTTTITDDNTAASHGDQTTTAVDTTAALTPQAHRKGKETRPLLHLESLTLQHSVVTHDHLRTLLASTKHSLHTLRLCYVSGLTRPQLRSLLNMAGRKLKTLALEGLIFTSTAPPANMPPAALPPPAFVAPLAPHYLQIPHHAFDAAIDAPFHHLFGPPHHHHHHHHQPHHMGFGGGAGFGVTGAAVPAVNNHGNNAIPNLAVGGAIDNPAALPHGPGVQNPFAANLLPLVPIPAADAVLENLAAMCPMLEELQVASAGLCSEGRFLTRVVPSLFLTVLQLDFTYPAVTEEHLLQMISNLPAGRMETLCLGPHLEAIVSPRLLRACLESRIVLLY